MDERSDSVVEWATYTAQLPQRQNHVSTKTMRNRATRKTPAVLGLGPPGVSLGSPGAQVPKWWPALDFFRRFNEDVILIFTLNSWNENTNDGGQAPSFCLEQPPSWTVCFNPLEFRGNYSATSNNMKLVHWPVMGGLLHLVQRGGDWAGPQPAGPSSLYQM